MPTVLYCNNLTKYIYCKLSYISKISYSRLFLAVKSVYSKVTANTFIVNS